MSEISWMNELEDIPRKALDPLADAVMSRYNGAVNCLSSEKVNGRSVKSTLENCYNQYNGIITGNDLKRAQALGVDAVVNITALKCDVAKTSLVDALVSGNATLPWVIYPTPKPDISKPARNIVLEKVKERVFSNSLASADELVEFIRAEKRAIYQHELDVASKAASEMMLLMEDQCAEGGFSTALADFISDFPIYPFAVFTGPYITRGPRMVWGKNRPRLTTEVYATFRAIRPFDFVYSPDSPDTQRGTCVFTRTRWTRRELLAASKLPSYIQENVRDVLESADSSTSESLAWLSSPDLHTKHALKFWASNVTPIEVLTHYGIMSGNELQKYNIQGLDKDDFYNCEIAMACHRVIQVKVMTNPAMQVRPIYTASFYDTGGDRIAGDGIAQRVRDVERAYHACLMYLMRNASNASAPMCEVDIRRMINQTSDSDLGQIIPGTMYFTNSDLGNSNSPAMKFFNIPSNIPAYAQLMNMFMQLADRVTNIPASAHGEAVGSGAMRTFRGMAMLQGNASKALNSAVTNISNRIFVPLGELLFNMNMLYSNDTKVKGDSKILAKGTDGILAKEMEKQSAMETLQILGAVGQQLGQIVNVTPGLAWAVKKLFGNMGMPDSVVSAMGDPIQGAVPNGNPPLTTYGEESLPQAPVEAQ